MGCCRKGSDCCARFSTQCFVSECSKSWFEFGRGEGRSMLNFSVEMSGFVGYVIERRCVVRGLKI